jgi:hypothetical protein
MLKVVDRDAKPPQAEGVDQKTQKNVPENEANPQDMAFETWLSKQPWNLKSRGSDQTDPREIVRAAMANSHLAGRQLPANGRESPGRIARSPGASRPSA